MTLIPVLLAGGEGRRLWPLSTPERPKQFLPLKDGECLLAHAARRALGAASPERVVTITSARHVALAREALAGVKEGLAGHIIAEPSARNTAAALTVAALYAQEHFGGNALLWALPADHYIEDNTVLLAALRCARPYAEVGNIVTFGIVPTHPEPQYGYIQYSSSPELRSSYRAIQLSAMGAICRGDAALTGFPYSFCKSKNSGNDGEEKSSVYNVYKVTQFIEKPEAEVAAGLLAGGNALWNSGMFLCRADALLAAVEKHAPPIYAGCRRAWPALEAADYETITALPIDRAVMEKADNIVVVPLDAGWADIGTKEAWEAFA